MANDQDYICFEQPLNERIRTFLRLEFLFQEVAYHRDDPSHWGRRATVRALLDTLTLLGRSDIKTDVIKELTEQIQALRRLEQRAGVDSTRLGEVLQQLDDSAAAMHGMSARSAGTLLKTNEMLSAILHRSAIPGGTCAFDLPGFAHWLGQPATRQEDDLTAWDRDLRPFREAIGLILALIRQSSEPAPQSAESGVYVHTLNAPCQMVRVLTATPGALYPEISAGKHRFSIRFMQRHDASEHAVATTEDVHFHLACCVIGG